MSELNNIVSYWGGKTVSLVVCVYKIKILVSLFFL